MAYSYTVNTGGLSTSFDREYMRTIMGFSGSNIVNYTLHTDSGTGAIDVGTLNTFKNISMLKTEYEAKFGTTLAISDNYKLFDEDKTMTRLLSQTNLPQASYTSDKAVTMTEVYKEMFLEKLGSTLATTSLDAPDFWMYGASYNFGVTNTKAGLIDLYTKLEGEANILKSGLNTGTLAYRGYPEIGYSAVDAEIELLENQLQAANQEFLKLVDDMYGHYRIQAGGYMYDNDDTDNDKVRREQEAGTAAMMISTLAMNYAQDYYSQSVKPVIADYVFGQVPILFVDHDSQSYKTRYLVGGVEVQSATGVDTYVDTSPAQYDGNGDIIQEYASTTWTKMDGTFLVNTTATATTDYFYNGTWGNAAKPPVVVASTVGAQNDMLTNSLMNYGTSKANLDNILVDNNSGYTMFNKASLCDNTGYLWTMVTDGGDIKEELNKDKGSELETNPLDELGNSTTEYIKWLVRDSFGVGGITKTIRNTTYGSTDVQFIANDIFSAAQKLVDIKMQIQLKVIESAINNQARAEYEARVGTMEAISKVLANCDTGTDPYTVDIDGQKYILGQDLNDDGTINNITEILGIRDTQENIFASMKNLDTNNDGYVSQEEMKAHNIILNAVDKESGQLKNSGYDMGLVKGINLADLQVADGQNNIFGRFTMDLQDKKVNGDLTFEDNSYFDKLFGSNVDFSVLSEAIPKPSSIFAKSVPVEASKVNSEESVTEREAEQSVEVTNSKEAESNTYSLFDAKNFTFDFVGAEDNKSAFEKLLDQISWQMNINNLTSTQKYGILDSLDASQDVDLAKSEIQYKLEQINLSA